MFESQLDKLKSLMPVVKAADNTETTGLFRFLVERVKNPDSYVVFLGETSSGKSSIINGIIGDRILPVSARPSTGAITEIVFSQDTGSIEYHQCRKDGTLVKLSKPEFEKQTWTPDKAAARLRVSIPSQGFVPGLRLFDTPGYNSVVEEHEEVLRDFLPNCDAVVYTLGYRIGIQHEDFTFLRFLKELVNDDIPIVVAINRCPAGTGMNNRRVQEISKYVTDIIGRKPEIFLVDAVVSENENETALPVNKAMWQHIVSSLNSKARQAKLAEAFDSYILDLFNQCNGIIKIRLEKAKISEDEFNSIKAAQAEYASHLRDAIPNLIEPVFAAIERQIPTKVNEVADTARKAIYDDIDAAGSLDMEREVSYINSHLMPFKVRSLGKDVINRYIEIELNDLNDRMDDYIQKEIIKLNDRIAIQVKTNTDVVVNNLVSKGLSRAGTSGLTSYAVSFGGAGGANAGIANAASHILKKTGDLFGKTFSRATHNSVKHFLSKIGATSIKRVGGAIAILAELLVFTIEVCTWKGKAKKNVAKGLDKWKEETIPEVIRELKKLKITNISTIEEIANNELHAFDDEKPSGNYNLAQLQADSDLADRWAQQYKIK